MRRLRSFCLRDIQSLIMPGVNDIVICFQYWCIAKLKNKICQYFTAVSVNSINLRNHMYFLLLFIKIIINRLLVNIFLSWNEICTYSVVNYQHNFAHLIQEGSDSLFSYYNFLTYSTIVIWTCITILIKKGQMHFILIKTLR